MPNDRFRARRRIADKKARAVLHTGSEWAYIRALGNLNSRAGLQAIRRSPTPADRWPGDDDWCRTTNGLCSRKTIARRLRFLRRRYLRAM